MRTYFPLVAVSLTAAAFLSLSAAAQNTARGVRTAPLPAHGNADAIGEDELKAYLYFLASDALEGRNFPSRGYDTAALYVASHLAEWGVKPGGNANGTDGPLQPYFMPIEMESRQLLTEESKATLTVSPDPRPVEQLAPPSTTFDYGKDWFYGTPGSPAPLGATFDVSGKLVFAGNGWVVHKTNADPYKGIDVRGKIIVVAGRLPEVVQGEACADVFSPQQYAAKNGALAVVFIADFSNAASMARLNLTRASPNGPPYVVKTSHPGSNCPSAPIVTVGLEVTSALFVGERRNGAEILYTADRNASTYQPSFQGERRTVPTPESFALNDRKTMRLHLAVRSDEGHGENVIGIVEGADPVLKNEYVIVSAHLDHLGLSAPQPGGHAVFNGADDDASGSAGLLAVARAYAIGAAHGMRPKRSMLFLWNGGEEKSLAGSQYFVRFPPIDLAKVVAVVHMDMIGRTRNPNSVDPDKTHVLVDRGEIFLIGPDISSSDLEKTIEAVNGDYQKLKLNHFYDTTKPDETHDNLGQQGRGQGLFARSDQYNFALMGIPIAYFTTGLHVDYHRPTDTPEKIDYRQLQMVARTAAAVGWDLGNQSGRPKLNAILPGDLKSAMERARMN